MLSDLCREFECLPSAIKREDWTVVLGILEYRTASAAVETFNMKDRKGAAERLMTTPALAEMLARMARAQQGLPLEGGNLAADGAEVFEAYRLPPEDDDEEVA